MNLAYSKDVFYERLKEKGFKLTPQRKIIIDSLISHNKKHITIEELYAHVIRKTKNIGLTTVYRSVQLFCNLNLIEKIHLDDGAVRYELIDGNNLHRHHHLICNNCGKIVEVKEDLMDSIEKIFEENYDFFVSNHQANFYGICSSCI